MLFTEILGWVGMICALLAYFLISNKKVLPESKLYQIINFIAAISLMINAIKHKAWAFVGLNIIWAIIALKVLLEIYKKRLDKNL